MKKTHAIVVALDVVVWDSLVTTSLNDRGSSDINIVNRLVPVSRVMS